MKSSFLGLFLAFLSFTAFAQVSSPHDGITVTGIAEMAFEPEYLIVVLQNLESQNAGSDRNSTARKERALIGTLKALGFDTSMLSVHRFGVSEYVSYFKVDRLGVDKSYSLRIFDLAHYEDIIMAISKTGFDHIRIATLGVNDEARKEGMVIRAAINSGQSKASETWSAMYGGAAAATSAGKPVLMSIEEMPNNFRHDQNNRPDSRTRNQELSIGGGSTIGALNLGLDKVIIRKAFLMRYAIK